MPKKNHAIHIRRQLTNQGLTVEIGRKKYNLFYPPRVWRQFPQNYKQEFANIVTYSLTVHLSFEKFRANRELFYHFPHPILEPLFFKGILYSLPEDMSVPGVTTTDYLKLLFNSFQRIHFQGQSPLQTHSDNILPKKENQALIPFTFGKDSLLTFALTRELGIKPIIVFFCEPLASFENQHKVRLAKKFAKEFGQKIIFRPVSLGILRKTSQENPWWGWDPLLTQYTLLLTPYYFFYRPKYLFWSHEQSCNFTIRDKEGYLIYPVFDQNHQWLMTTNSSFKILGFNSFFSSLVEPLHEIAITYILHRRYPEIAKYQNSCFGEGTRAKTRRWCGACSKCARMYIFFQALGIDPAKMDFDQKMLEGRKRSLYSLFENKSAQQGTYDLSGAGRDELLLAFYLAQRRGVKGTLVKEFEQRYLKEAQRRKTELFQTFFSVYPPQTIDPQLKKPLLKIFKNELKELKKLIFEKDHQC